MPIIRTAGRGFCPNGLCGRRGRVMCLRKFRRLRDIQRNNMRYWAALVWVLAGLCGPAAATVYELPENGSAVFGSDVRIKATYQDTLLDIARRYSLGYEEIIRANPGVDMWLPGEGTDILLP